MTDPVAWTCRCGAFRASIDPRSGTRIACHCRFCRAFVLALGRPELLDDGGGTELFQTVPGRIRIAAGNGNLDCLRIASIGPNRWYAACCDTPFCNALQKPSPPYAAVLIGAGSDPSAFGRMRFRAFRSQATGPVAPAGPAAVVSVALIARTVSAIATGAHNPFFNADGMPIAAPRRLTGEERRRTA